MQCSHFKSQRCRSCTLLSDHVDNNDYGTVLAQKYQLLQAQLAPWSQVLAAAVASDPAQGMRNKAKMAVGGTLENPILGIPLRAESPRWMIADCSLHHPDLNTIIVELPAWITRLNIPPYQVETQKGELKFVILHRAAGSGEVMLRFVLRSKEALDRLKKALPLMQQHWPQVKVITVNIHPRHSALSEGDEEIVLTARSSIAAQVGRAQLLLGPGSFFQTNDAVAAQLYGRAAEIIAQYTRPGETVLDLYCGVGGFAQHLARLPRRVLAYEYSSPAIALAKESQGQLDIDYFQADLEKDDVAALTNGQAKAAVVNPPRRGLSPRLRQRLAQSTLSTIVYSSCSPESLARDLADLAPFYQVESITPMDMFPWSEHWECLVTLQRLDYHQS